jgi:hypothetical protein
MAGTGEAGGAGRGKTGPGMARCGRVGLEGRGEAGKDWRGMAG